MSGEPESIRTQVCKFYKPRKKSGSSSGGKIRFFGFFGLGFRGFLPIAKYAMGPNMPVSKIAKSHPHLGSLRISVSSRRAQSMKV